MKMNRQAFFAVFALAASGAFAQSAGGAGSFLKDQAMAEMQRVSAQVDVLASNQEDLSSRLRRLESANKDREIADLRAEIAALKAEFARRLQEQREEIVRELAKKIAGMQPKAPPPPPPPPKPTYSGPVYEYTVQSGDTLSLIAKAFGSTVKRIKEVNGMKGDALKIGQKIVVPKE